VPWRDVIDERVVRATKLHAGAFGEPRDAPRFAEVAAFPGFVNRNS
jgi:hypothetical protein